MTYEEAVQAVSLQIIERQMPGVKPEHRAAYLAAFGVPALTRMDDGGYLLTSRFLPGAARRLMEYENGKAA
jgi:hypothetical protein